MMTRPDPALVAEVMAENRPRLLAIVEQVQQAIATTTQGKSDKPTTPPTRKAA